MCAKMCVWEGQSIQISIVLPRRDFKLYVLFELTRGVGGRGAKEKKETDLLMLQ